MPFVAYTHRVKAPVSTLWDQIQDFSLWAKDIPGYESHEEISPDESIWTVQGNVGALNRRVDFRVLVTQRVEPRLVTFTLEGLNENVSGSGSFEAAGDATTSDDAAPEHCLRSPQPASWWRRAFFGVVRRIFRRAFRDERPKFEATANGITEFDSAATTFTCTLELQAGGLMGPVVNTLMEPLLEPAAAQLAGNIATAVEAVAHGRSAQLSRDSEGAIAETAAPTADSPRLSR